MRRRSATAGALGPPPIPALTGLRFVAALLVFVSHYPVPGAAGTPLRMMQSGYMGVTVFFVLSGFILTYNYLHRLEGGLDAGVVGDFLLARLARIYPLYAVLILFVWLGSAPGALPVWPYLLAIQTWSPDVNVAFGLVGPSWSIGVEVFLYLAFPILVPLVIRFGILTSARRLALATALVAVAMIATAAWFSMTGRGALSIFDPASAHRWLYRTPVTRLGDFMLGMLGAIYCLRFAHDDAITRRRWRIAASAGVGLTLLFLAAPALFYSSFGWDAAYALPAAVIFVALTLDPHTRAARFLATAPMLLLGEASYAFYLIHRLASPWRAADPNGAASLALYALFVVLVTASAIAIHLAFERPARRMIRSLVRIPAPARATAHASARG
jgi:peptidoglycan/LPS O-acetylase OafA/YrhL